MRTWGWCLLGFLSVCQSVSAYPPSRYGCGDYFKEMRGAQIVIACHDHEFLDHLEHCGVDCARYLPTLPPHVITGQLPPRTRPPPLEGEYFYYEATTSDPLSHSQAQLLHQGSVQEHQEEAAPEQDHTFNQRTTTVSPLPHDMSHIDLQDNYQEKEESTTPDDSDDGAAGPEIHLGLVIDDSSTIQGLTLTGGSDDYNYSNPFHNMGQGLQAFPSHASQPTHGHGRQIHYHHHQHHHNYPGSDGDEDESDSGDSGMGVGQWESWNSQGQVDYDRRDRRDRKRGRGRPGRERPQRPRQSFNWRQGLRG